MEKQYFAAQQPMPSSTTGSQFDDGTFSDSAEDDYASSGGAQTPLSTLSDALEPVPASEAPVVGASTRVSPVTASDTLLVSFPQRSVDPVSISPPPGTDASKEKRGSVRFAAGVLKRLRRKTSSASSLGDA